MDDISVFGIAIIVLIVFAVIIVSRAVRTVPQGENWTVERFGRYIRTLGPGLRFMIPVFEAVGARVNMMETVLDVEGQEVITRDNAMVHADAISFYQVIDAAQSAYEVRHLERALRNLAMTNIRTVIGAMDLDDVLSNRDTINSKLLHVIDDAAHPWGVKVTRVEIKDLRPPEDIVEAMGKQMKAEREKRAEILEAEGLKQAAILKAEGRRQAAFLDAEARERAAQAEAKATSAVSEAIAAGDVQAINYFVAQKYVDSLRDVAAAPNSKTVLIPIDAAGIAGAVAGVAELTKTIGSKSG
jgi:regulator of protease activity HflC (stomatin/prohibitin superfamily)